MHQCTRGTASLPSTHCKPALTSGVGPARCAQHLRKNCPAPLNVVMLSLTSWQFWSAHQLKNTPEYQLVERFLLHMIDSCDASYWCGLLKKKHFCVASKLQLKAHPNAVFLAVWVVASPEIDTKCQVQLEETLLFPPRKVSTQLPDPTLPSGARSCRAQPSASRDRLLLFTIQSWPHQLGTLSSGQKASYDYAGLQDCKVSALFFTTGAPDSTKVWIIGSTQWDSITETDQFPEKRNLLQLAQNHRSAHQTCQWGVRGLSMMGQVWFQLLGTVSHVQFAMPNILPHLLWRKRKKWGRNRRMKKQDQEKENHIMQAKIIY